MEGKNCKEKQKTNIARRTLDPLYQQQLYFTQPYNGCILQVCHGIVIHYQRVTGQKWGESLVESERGWGL